VAVVDIGIDGARRVREEAAVTSCLTEEDQ